VLAYIERNPLRAKLVRRAEDWAWSSLSAFASKSRPAFLVQGPVNRPRAWLAQVNRNDEPLADPRTCVNRGAPFGTREWTRRIAARLGLESSLRARGRPRLQPQKQKPQK